MVLEGGGSNVGYRAGGAMQSFISGGRIDKSEMLYESFLLFINFCATH